jgi:NADPH:quinone reductase-like Zn-dependent oxidoreductase
VTAWLWSLVFLAANAKLADQADTKYVWCQHIFVFYIFIVFKKLCPDMEFAATPPHDGTLARFYRLPEDLVYRLPEHLSLEDGAMVQ